MKKCMHLPNQNWDHKTLEEVELTEAKKGKRVLEVTEEKFEVVEKKNKVIDLCPHGTEEWREFLKGREKKFEAAASLCLRILSPTCNVIPSGLITCC